jgi:hypothetical protein
MIQKTNQKLFFLNLLLMLNFTNIMSLSLSRYKIRDLDISIVDKKLATKDPNISCEYKIFTKKDCNRYFGLCCKIKFIDQGYQPILIKFTNNSDKAVNFSFNYFNIPCIPFDIVAEPSEIITAKDILAGGILAYILIPCGILFHRAFIYCAYHFPIIIAPTICICIGYEFYYIYKNLTSSAKPPSQNKKLYDKYSKKLLREQTVEPFSAINGLIFVHKKDLDQYGIAFKENI